MFIQTGIYMKKKFLTNIINKSIYRYIFQLKIHFDTNSDFLKSREINQTYKLPHDEVLNIK